MSGRCERTASTSASRVCARFTSILLVSCARSPMMQATPASAPISWSRFDHWSRREPRSSFGRWPADAAVCARAPIHYRRRAGAQRHLGGGKGRGDGACATPPHRLGGQPPRYLRQGIGGVRGGVPRKALVNRPARAHRREGALVATRARRDAGNPIVLNPHVPPHVDQHLGSPRSPREPLRETQIRRSLLEAGELDLEWARRGRTTRCICNEDAAPCPLHAARLGNANVA